MRGAGNRNMAGDGSNKRSGDMGDNNKSGRNEADDTKMNILSNIQSMMPGEQVKVVLIIMDMMCEVFLIGRRSLVNGAVNRNMVGDGSKKQSGAPEDNTKAGRSSAEDTKMNILSNIQSMIQVR